MQSTYRTGSSHENLGPQGLRYASLLVLRPVLTADPTNLVRTLFLKYTETENGDNARMFLFPHVYPAV